MIVGASGSYSQNMVKGLFFLPSTKKKGSFFFLNRRVFSESAVYLILFFFTVTETEEFFFLPPAKLKGSCFGHFFLSWPKDFPEMS